MKDYRSNDVTGRLIMGVIIVVIVSLVIGIIKLFEWLSNL